jgi:hypothetical protein
MNNDFIEKLRSWSYQKQMLGKQAKDLVHALRAVIGVYSPHPSGPLSLFARAQTFSEEAFYELDSKHLARRIPAMRMSNYMLPRETAHLAFRAAVPDAADPYWEKRYSGPQRLIPPEEYGTWKNELITLLDEPMTGAEIKERTGIPEETVKFVLNRMAFEGSLFRVGAKSLRSNIISYLAVPSGERDNYLRFDHEKALEWLAGEYLRAFGPARIRDFQWWTGVTAGKARTAMSAHSTTEIGDGYVVASSDLRDFESFQIPKKDTVDLLPQWDCYTMGYAPDGRERFVSRDTQGQIYGKIGATGGNAIGVVLVNGLAHGAWDSRFKGEKMQVNLNMFEKLPAKTADRVNDSFREVASLLKAKSLEFIEK